MMQHDGDHLVSVYALNIVVIVAFVVVSVNADVVVAVVASNTVVAVVVDVALIQDFQWNSLPIHYFRMPM